MCDILVLPELKECRLLCREVGCSQLVKSITIMDNPEILQWLNEYEVLLSNGSSLVNLNIQEWKAFFYGLVQKNVAALFIKLDYYIKRLPEEVIAYTRALDFPVVIVPNSYSWVQITDPIQRFMIERQFYFMGETLALRDALNEILVHGGSLDDVCRAASEDIGCATAVLSEDMHLLGCSQPDIWEQVTLTLRQKSLQVTRQSGGADEKGRLGDICQNVDSHPGGTRTRYPCATVGLVQAKAVLFRIPDRLGKHYVVYLLENDAPWFGELDLLKIEQINTSLMLCVYKEMELNRVERHYYVDFLLDLIDGVLLDKAEISDKAERLGRKVHCAYQLIAFDNNGQNTRVALSEMVSLFKQEPDSLIRDTMYCEHASKVILFLPVWGVEDRQRIAHVCERVLECLGAPGMQFGVSRAYAIEQAYLAYEEAAFALSMKGLDHRRSIYFEDLGILRIFGMNPEKADTAFMAEYYERTIGTLANYDQENNTQLLETLRVYLDSERSIALAAKTLYLHENTLRARIKQIEAITARSLKSSLGITELVIGSLIDRILHC